MPHLNQKPFPSDTAGSKMISDIPVVAPQMSIDEVLIKIQKEIKKLETINYIYVLDHERKLTGVFSIKEIFRAPKEKKVQDLMKKDLVTVEPLTDQEKVAYLALKHNLKAIPVVDNQNRFLGIVPSDILLKILYKEATEDVLRLSGIQSQVIRLIRAPVAEAARVRLPWIFLGLLGGLVSGSIIGIFKPSLESFIALAVYIPVMMHTGGNVGNQSAMIFIRGLLIGENRDIKNYFLREIKIGLAIGSVCAILLSLFSLLWQGSPIFGLIVGLSILATIFVAAAVGILVPWLLHKFNLDPAIGAGPFITTLQDTLALLIYFSIASLMMRYFL